MDQDLCKDKQDAVVRARLIQSWRMIAPVMEEINQTRHGISIVDFDIGKDSPSKMARGH
jgi:hypothetical protein